MNAMQFLQHLEDKLERHKPSTITLARWERTALQRLRGGIPYASSRFVQHKFTVKLAVQRAYAMSSVVTHIADQVTAKLLDIR